MKSPRAFSFPVVGGIWLFALLMLAGPAARAAAMTNFSVFAGTITLDGDISDFFLPDGVTNKPGVCVMDDTLDEAPLAGETTKDGLLHPSGFNQRRIMSAYNPNLNGGTIYVGVDLPGGSGASSASKTVHASPGNPNPNFADGVVGPGGSGNRGPGILPFDADGNGETETIGYDGLTPLRRCTDPGAMNILLTDVIDCNKPDSGGFTDAVTPADDPGNKERYAVTIIFGDIGNTTVQAELFEDNSTPFGKAGLSDAGTTPGKTFGILANTDGSSNVLGFDVEFAITNVNANVDECGRLVQVIVVNSGSLQDGSANGEDFNVLSCTYVLPPGLQVTKQCPPTNAAPGTLLVFTGTVTNSGQVTLTNVSVFNDQPVPDTLVASFLSLAPGQSLNFTNSYTVPTNVCSITDTLFARGTNICSLEAVTATTNATCLVSNTPLLQVVKMCPPTNAAPGTLVVFTGTVTNTGNIAITNIGLTNVVFGSPAAVVPPVIAILQPGQGASFSGSYTAPTNVCSVPDTVTATGRDVCGTFVSASDMEVCTITNTPLLQVVKMCPPTNAAPGTLVVFTGTVTNTGSITITNIGLTNVVLGSPVAVVPPVIAILEPGQGAAFTGSYPAPTNGCSVADTVTATGRDLCGTFVSGSDTEVCTITNMPLLQVVKICPPTNAAPGTLVVFTGTVTNTGNIAITNIGLTSVVFGSPAAVVPPVIAILQPGQGASFSGSYTAPTNVCSVPDTVTATGRDVCGTFVSASDMEVCTITNTPLIRVTKMCPPDPVGPGGTVMFTGTVSNAGNITLTNVTVVNDRPTNNTPVFGPMTLLPGQSAPLAGSYVVPTNHPDCFIEDKLVAVGFDICNGTLVMDMATASCPLTNRLTVKLFCPTNNVVPPVDDQMTSTNPICVSMVDGLPLSFLKATLVNVPDGYVVTNGMYPGWCVDYEAVIQINQLYKPILYLSTAPLPPHLQDTNWNKINYILNHKQGSGKDIQGAIWHFIGGPVPPDDPDGYFPPSATTANIVADTEANGCDFMPGIGDIVAVILDIPDFNGQRIQRNIIEALCPTNLNLCFGSDAEICALASGPGPFGYMWFKDNVVIPDQTNSCLALTNVMSGDAGNYCVKVTGFCGEATNCVPVIVTNCPGVIGPVRLTSLGRMPSGAFKITLQSLGALGRSYMVEASEDLVTWRQLPPAVVNTDGTLEFFDPAATTKCFYRVFMEP